jgi:hypothetical protein
LKPASQTLYGVTSAEDTCLDQIKRHEIFTNLYQNAGHEIGTINSLPPCKIVVMKSGQ